MKIKRVENSFLLKNSELIAFGSVLVNCCLKTFQSLSEEEIKEIEYVIITADNEKHTGSLESLINYRFNRFNRKTCIISPIKRVRKRFKRLNRSFQYGRFEKEIKVVALKEKHSFEFVKGWNYDKSYGVFLEFFNKMIYITGETRECKSVMKTIEHIESRRNWKVEGLPIPYKIISNGINHKTLNITKIEEVSKKWENI